MLKDKHVLSVLVIEFDIPSAVCHRTKNGQWSEIGSGIGCLSTNDRYLFQDLLSLIVRMVRVEPGQDGEASFAVGNGELETLKSESADDEVECLSRIAFLSVPIQVSTDTLDLLDPVDRFHLGRKLDLSHDVRDFHELAGRWFHARSDVQREAFRAFVAQF